MGHALPTLNDHEGYRLGAEPTQLVHQRRLVWPLVSVCGLRVGDAPAHHGWSWSAKAVTCDYCLSRIPHPDHARSVSTASITPRSGAGDFPLGYLEPLERPDDVMTSQRHDDRDEIAEFVSDVADVVAVGSALLDLFDSPSRSGGDSSSSQSDDAPSDFEGGGGKFGGGGATGSWD